MYANLFTNNYSKLIIKKKSTCEKELYKATTFLRRVLLILHRHTSPKVWLDRSQPVLTMASAI